MSSARIQRGLRRAVLMLTGIAAVLGGAVWVIQPDILFLPHRFRQVEAGRLYRGGDPSTDELARLARKYGVRTVVSMLDDKPRGADNIRELQRAEQCGLRFFNYPMPGNGLGDFDALDAAADRLAERENGPIYFHCAAGKNRSGAVQAAWRMRHCGWTIDQALAELRDFGMDPIEDKKLADHLRNYYESRIASGIR